MANQREGCGLGDAHSALLALLAAASGGIVGQSTAYFHAHPPGHPRPAHPVTPAPTVCTVFGIFDGQAEQSRVFQTNFELGTTSALDQRRPPDLDGIAEHPTTRVLYVLVDGGDHHSTRLAKVDADSGELVEVGDTRFSRLTGLTFRQSDATLWAWSVRRVWSSSTLRGVTYLRFTSRQR
jgi:hypothetical protein